MNKRKSVHDSWYKLFVGAFSNYGGYNTNKFFHSWAIELNTWREIPHLRAPTYYSLWIGDSVKNWLSCQGKIFLELESKNSYLDRGINCITAMLQAWKTEHFKCFSKEACSLSWVLSVSDIFLWYTCSLSVKVNIFYFTDITHAVLEQ